MSIKNKLIESALVNKATNKLYQSKPIIYVTLGMIGSVASAYLAWKAGKETKETIEEVKNDISEARETAKDREKLEEAGKKGWVLLCEAYANGGLKICKVIGPAVGLEIVSLGLIGKGVGIISDRLSNAIETCGLYASTLAGYRDRVRDKVGDDEERKLYYGITEREYEEVETNKNGEPKLDREGKPKIRRTKQEVLSEELAKHSMYAQIFDAEHTEEFEYDPKTLKENYIYNNKFVRDWETYFNRQIRYSYRHTYALNDILKELGFKRTAAGQIMGYHAEIDPETREMRFVAVDPHTGEKRYLDEGIRIELFPVMYEEYNENTCKYELRKCYIMDFNVQTNILSFYD